MSKGILEFDLPEEEYEHLQAANVRNFANVVSEIDNHCRTKIKHHELSGEHQHDLEHIRAIISEVRELL